MERKTILILSVLVVIAVVSLLTLSNTTKKISRGTVISITNSQGKAGQTVKIGVDLRNSPASKIAGFDFSMSYDKDILLEPKVTGTDILRKAGKSVAFNTPKDGLLKVVVIGINRNVIESGRILDISFRIKPEAKPGETSVTIHKVNGVDLDARAVNISVENGIIEIIK